MVKRDEEAVLRAIKYMEENLGRFIGLSEITKTFGCSHWHAQRVFRKTVGVTIMEYFQGLRLNRAAVLLRTTNMSFAAISEQLGRSYTHFATFFKKVHGIGPNKFRRQGRNPTKWTKRS